MLTLSVYLLCYVCQCGIAAPLCYIWTQFQRDTRCLWFQVVISSANQTQSWRAHAVSKTTGGFVLVGMLKMGIFAEAIMIHHICGVHLRIDGNKPPVVCENTNLTDFTPGSKCTHIPGGNTKNLKPWWSNFFSKQLQLRLLETVWGQCWLVSHSSNKVFRLASMERSIHFKQERIQWLGTAVYLNPLLSGILGWCPGVLAVVESGTFCWPAGTVLGSGNNVFGRDFTWLYPQGLKAVKVCRRKKRGGCVS